jgi:phytoene synthase
MRSPPTDSLVHRDDPEAFLALARQHYENFPVGSLLVPRRLRRHVHRIYAFARIADDIADERRDAALLARYRADFLAHRRGETAGLPLFVDLSATIEELGLPEQLFLDLLEAFAQDLRVRRYGSEAELFAYCRLSADPVGRLVLRVFGHDDPALDALSDRICTGLQLLNHLQDLGEDLRDRDRIYFPEPDLVRFGVAPDDLLAARAGDGLRALVRHWLDRTVAMFADGWPLTEAVRGRLRLELRAIVGSACAVARRIRACDHDVLGGAVELPKIGKVGALLRAFSGRRPPELRRPGPR